jgi:hypothetical protein
MSGYHLGKSSPSNHLLELESLGSFDICYVVYTNLNVLSLKSRTKLLHQFNFQVAVPFQCHLGSISVISSTRAAFTPASRWLHASFTPAARRIHAIIPPTSALSEPKKTQKSSFWHKFRDFRKLGGTRGNSGFV